MTSPGFERRARATDVPPTVSQQFFPQDFDGQDVDGQDERAFLHKRGAYHRVIEDDSRFMCSQERGRSKALTGRRVPGS